MVNYNLIKFTSGMSGEAYQEVYNEGVVRYINLSGDEISLTEKCEYFIVEFGAIPDVVNISYEPPVQTDEEKLEAVQQNIIYEKERYKKRLDDALEAYLLMLSELRLNSVKNNYPRIINQSIQKKLKDVIEVLLTARWITALEELEFVEADQYCTQELLDRIRLKLKTYISENY